MLLPSSSFLGMVNMESAVMAAPSGTVSIEESAAAMKPRPNTHRPNRPTVSRISSASLSIVNASSSALQTKNGRSIGVFDKN